MCWSGNFLIFLYLYTLHWAIASSRHWYSDPLYSKTLSGYITITISLLIDIGIIGKEVKNGDNQTYQSEKNVDQSGACSPQFFDSWLCYHIWSCKTTDGYIM